ncbi:hypothetical protein A2U01_0072326, partial [Trifolium medium]|nr:hypothetical protein [Trifolium medium]
MVVWGVHEYPCLEPSMSSSR